LYTNNDPVNEIDPNGLMTLGSLMGSMVSMMSTTAKIFSAANRVYNTVSTITSIVEIYQDFTSGLLFDLIMKQIRRTIQSMATSGYGTVTAKLANADFWQDASIALLQAIPKFMFVTFHYLPSIAQSLAQGKTKWLLYMPTPWEKWIPNPTYKVNLPFVKIAGHKVELQFGGGGTEGRKHRGRLWGLGLVTRTTSRSHPNTNQLFRMDYHPWTHTTDDYNFEIKGNGNDFHFHLRDH
jgi:hypothetical protein